MGYQTRVFQVFAIFMYSKITLLASEKTTKKKALPLEVFCVIKTTIWACQYFSRFIFYFLIEKLLGCVSHTPNEWVAPTPFNRYVRRFSVANFCHPSSNWICSCALFHMAWHVQTYNDCIAVGDRLFVFFLYFLFPDN